jgi:putative CocE/NonD family hydrolase
VLNSKKWRNLYSWPPPSEDHKLYIHSKGKANTRFGDGTLSTSEPGEENADSYDFDPSNPAPMYGGRNLFLLSGAQNQSKIEKRSDILVYTTPKLKQGMELIGEFKLVLYASSSAKDTDFMVKLVDVFPSGRKAVNIIDSGVRARFRDGDMNNPSYIEPGKIYKYEIYVGSTAIYFPKNHRIRVEISSSHFPRFNVNSNLGDDKSGKKYIIANQTIYHDKEHPTHLILPKYKSK